MSVRERAIFSFTFNASKESGVGSGVIFPDLLIAQKSPELSKIDRIDFSMLYFLYFLVPIFDYTDPQ